VPGEVECESGHNPCCLNCATITAVSEIPVCPICYEKLPDDEKWDEELTSEQTHDEWRR
jgi:hypothetical protein